MASILTNTSAMTALQNLNQTNRDLATTTERIATGLKVGSAKDNAAYFSIATTMRSDNKALSAVDDAMGLGAANIDVATTGMNAAIDITDQIKAKLVTASQPGVDRGKIQSEIGELQKQLTSVATASNFSGQNMLSVKSDAADFNATRKIVASFNRDAAGAVTLGTIDVDVSSTKLFDSAAAATGILDKESTATSGTTFTVANLDISALTDSSADLTDIGDMISAVDTAIQSMTTASADLGSQRARIDIQQEFVSNLMGAIDRGVGSLVDADLNQESTRLQALQVQQQLGVQAMSIANQSSQSILSLFR